MASSYILLIEADPRVIGQIDGRQTQPTGDAPRRHQNRGRVAVPVAVCLGQLDAADIKGGAESVGFGGGGRNYRTRQDSLRRTAAAGIENVAIPFALVVEELRSR